MSENTSDFDSAVSSTVTGAHPALVALARDLYDHPEVAWEEVRSAQRVASMLSDSGFDVDDGPLPEALPRERGSPT